MVINYSYFSSVKVFKNQSFTMSLFDSHISFIHVLLNLFIIKSYSRVIHRHFCCIVLYFVDHERTCLSVCSVRKENEKLILQIFNVLWLTLLLVVFIVQKYLFAV